MTQPLDKSLTNSGNMEIFWTVCILLTAQHFGWSQAKTTVDPPPTVIITKKPPNPIITSPQVKTTSTITPDPDTTPYTDYEYYDDDSVDAAVIGGAAGGSIVVTAIVVIVACCIIRARARAKNAGKAATYKDTSGDADEVNKLQTPPRDGNEYVPMDPVACEPNPDYVNPDQETVEYTDIADVEDNMMSGETSKQQSDYIHPVEKANRPQSPQARELISTVMELHAGSDCVALDPTYVNQGDVLKEVTEATDYIELGDLEDKPPIPARPAKPTKPEVIYTNDESMYVDMGEGGDNKTGNGGQEQTPYDSLRSCKSVEDEHAYESSQRF